MLTAARISFPLQAPLLMTIVSLRLRKIFVTTLEVEVALLPISIVTGTTALIGLVEAAHLPPVWCRPFSTASIRALPGTKRPTTLIVLEMVLLLPLWRLNMRRATFPSPRLTNVRCILPVSLLANRSRPTHFIELPRRLQQGIMGSRTDCCATPMITLPLLAGWQTASPKASLVLLWRRSSIQLAC